jgi:hypothetical protein
VWIRFFQCVIHVLSSQINLYMFNVKLNLVVWRELLQLNAMLLNFTFLCVHVYSIVPDMWLVLMLLLMIVSFTRNTSLNFYFYFPLFFSQYHTKLFPFLIHINPKPFCQSHKPLISVNPFQFTVLTWTLLQSQRTMIGNERTQRFTHIELAKCLNDRKRKNR